MNENLNLVEILKDCPKGTELYSIAYGNVRFEKINEGSRFPILVRANNNSAASFLANGKMYANYDGECALLPSKEQRDWSKFTAPGADEHPVNVWHDAKEKPRSKEWILVQFEEDEYQTLALSESGVDTWFNDWVDEYRAIRWAYISDLLPKGGEKKINT